MAPALALARPPRTAFGNPVCRDANAVDRFSTTVSKICAEHMCGHALRDTKTQIALQRAEGCVCVPPARLFQPWRRPRAVHDETRVVRLLLATQRWRGSMQFPLTVRPSLASAPAIRQTSCHLRSLKGSPPVATIKWFVSRMSSAPSPSSSNLLKISCAT